MANVHTAEISAKAARVKSYKTGTAATIKQDFRRNRDLVFMAIPIALYYIIFFYIPMGGIIVAFQDFSITKGIFNSEWVGFKHFIDFFSGVYAGRVIKNTLLISFYQLIFSFPMPIVLALLLNEIRCKPFKKTVQTITYLPHFISTVVVCGMLVNFLSRDGVINDIAAFFGAERVSYLLKPECFRFIYVASGIWQGVGWGSILYLSALSGIDTEQYEAAAIDGAGRLRQMLHVTLPGIAPTIVIMLIMQIGRMMSEGSEKIILLYNENTFKTADIISSFVYRRGIVEQNYSFSTAVGLFNSVVNLILLVVANTVSRKVNESSLW